MYNYNDHHKRTSPGMLNPKLLWEILKEGKRNGEFFQYVGMFLILLAIQLIIPIIVTVILFKFFGTGPFFNYSNGEMKAKAIKISNKGLIWNTDEGYILTGSMSEGIAEKWYYTAANQDVVECVNSNEKVALTYKQYALVPFRIGSSHNLVIKCEGI